MTAYTPTTAEIREAILSGIANRVVSLLLDLPVDEVRDIVQAGWNRWLATITPDPDNVAQVETVARVGAEMIRRVSLKNVEDDTEVQGLAERYARAILAALREVTGKETPTPTRTAPPPRPDYCCGKCPEIDGGYDCTCRDNPRCKKRVTGDE